MPFVTVYDAAEQEDALQGIPQRRRIYERGLECLLRHDVLSWRVKKIF
jgi:hypothetical protein